jgi:hypothetical protein
MAVGKKTGNGNIKGSPVHFIGAAIGIAGGVINMVQGNKAANEAKKAQAAAQAELNTQKRAFENLDRSNLYQGIQTEFENVYEDATIDQRAAEFQAQQGAQQRSNILESMKGAAGGSGVAALAQQMASQGQLAAQQQAATIGQQEQQNQAAMLRGAEMASRRGQAAEMQVIAGEKESRALEADKTQKLMGMASGQLQAANQAAQAAQQQKSQGLGQVIGGVGGMASGALKAFGSEKFLGSGMGKFLTSS